MGDSLLVAVRELLELTSKASGAEFFRGLTRGVAKSLGVKVGFIGALTPSRRAVETRAVWWDDHFIDNFEYPLGGTPCENVIGQAVCFFPERVQELFPSDEMLVQRGIHSYLGVPVNGADGTPLGILVALHDSPTPDLDGRAGGQLRPIFELFADRAGLELERLAAHEVLQASEARYRHIVNSTRDGVWIVDLDDRTTFVNAQMGRMLGWTAEEMIGRPLHDFVAAERWPAAAAQRARRARGISERHEFCFQRKDGGDLWTILSTNVIHDAAGAYAGAVALVADLTEVRALEQKIVQNQKLESLGLLAGGVAHDFNNLLTGILGNIGIALNELPASSGVRDVLSNAEVAGRRAADLIRQMLAYSGRGRFVVKRVSFNHIVEELAQLLASVISRRAQLVVELAPDLPEVDADATQLGQIVMNLITNASDALDGRDGVIRIETGVLAADGEYLASTYLDDSLSPGEYVFVEVTDTGAGMDAATRARIFDPFYTTKFTGRGLGLAAVLGILRGHHGAIDVASEPGKGSTFRILLPRATSSPQAAEAAAPERAPRTAALLVLVADDEPIVRRTARHVLEAEGYRVLLAEDGTEAVALYLEHGAEIDVALFDLTMPGMGGAEATRVIRQTHPAAKIVLTSGYDEGSTKAALGPDQVVGFLPKPWSPADLVRVIRETMAPLTET